MRGLVTAGAIDFFEFLGDRIAAPKQAAATSYCTVVGRPSPARRPSQLITASRQPEKSIIKITDRNTPARKLVAMSPIDGDSANEGTALLGGSKNGDHGINPMIDIERRNRIRLTRILAMCAIGTALVAAVLVWNAHLKAEQRRLARRSKLAQESLRVLNKHLHSQSKRIKKGCESTLLIMRHCEKIGPHVADDEGNVHCSYIGFERAKYLSTLFGNTPDERWPSPAHLFALHPDREGHWNFREWETLHPLGKKIGINVDITSRGELASEYFDLLQSGSLCGEVSVVSWKHEFIPELATNLGCGPDDGCPAEYPEDDFDQVWQLKFVFEPEDDAKHESKDESGLLRNNTTLDGETSAAHVSMHINGTDTTSTGEALYDKEDTVRRFLKNYAEGTSSVKKALKMMKKKKSDKKKDKAASNGSGWSVYAAIVPQGFDPLAFSKLSGDYPVGGTKRGGSWNGEL